MHDISSVASIYDIAKVFTGPPWMHIMTSVTVSVNVQVTTDFQHESPQYVYIHGVCIIVRCE